VGQRSPAKLAGLFRWPTRAKKPVRLRRKPVFTQYTFSLRSIGGFFYCPTSAKKPVLSGVEGQGPDAGKGLHVDVSGSPLSLHTHFISEVLSRLFLLSHLGEGFGSAQPPKFILRVTEGSIPMQDRDCALMYREAKP